VGASSEQRLRRGAGGRQNHVPSVAISQNLKSRKTKYNLTRNIRDNAMQQSAFGTQHKRFIVHERRDKIQLRFNRFLRWPLTPHTVFPAPVAAFRRMPLFFDK
jgi:hypothetical protein